MYEIFKTSQCEIVVGSMIKALMKRSPSYSEISRCDFCKDTKESIFQILYLNNDVFGNDLSNLSDAITANFEKDVTCGICKTIKVVQREFKSHLFIEVENSKLPFMLKWF